jgi:hypothetical protein
VNGLTNDNVAGRSEISGNVETLLVDLGGIFTVEKRVDDVSNSEVLVDGNFWSVEGSVESDIIFPGVEVVVNPGISFDLSEAGTSKS